MSTQLEDLVERARRLTETAERNVLGITGPPGAGKSTLCAALVRDLDDEVALIEMDGFHLATQELVRLGRSNRKGAPDTFDVGGYLHLLRRLKCQDEQVVYAPAFDRKIEESIGSAVPVFRQTRLVITEGNYLLRQEGNWSSVRAALDEVWYLDVDPEVRDARLSRRRKSFGHSAADADAWVREVDAVNAATVERTRHLADHVFVL